MNHAGIPARLAWSRSAMGRLTVALSLVLGVALLGISAQGADVADLTIGEGQPAERDYGPIAGQNPGAQAPRAPSDCAVQLYCDVADLTINVPGSYGTFDLYSVVIVLSWPNPDLNNLNLHLYDRNRTTTLLSSATANHPEKIEVLEPPAGRYFLTVNNVSGVNAGYKLKAEFVAKGRQPDTENPEEEFGSASQGGGANQEFGFVDPALDIPPVPETGLEAGSPRPVANPGPDGPTTKATLATLGVARGFKDNTSLTSIVLTAISILIAASFGTVLFIRHRRSLSEELSNT